MIDKERADMEERVAIIMEGCGLSERAAIKLYHEQMDAPNNCIQLQTRVQKMQMDQLEHKKQRYQKFKYLD